ncbi:MAG: hypothetical protein RLZZ340_695 [Actinomycetota bacterium]|jgi:uncharacterized OB-fold protein
MANKFCQHCGTQILAEAKFCAACGQAQAVTAPAAGGEEVHTFAATPAAPASSNKKTVFIAAGAAIVAIAIAVVFFIVKPGASASLDGKSASEVLSQLVDDGYCTEVDPRSGFTDYSMLIKLYDADTLRGCIESKSGNYFFIYANQSPSDLEDEKDSSTTTQNVYGKDWILEFVSTGNEAVLTEIAKQYNGTVQ